MPFYSVKVTAPAMVEQIIMVEADSKERAEIAARERTSLSPASNWMPIEGKVESPVRLTPTEVDRYGIPVRATDKLMTITVNHRDFVWDGGTGEPVRRARRLWGAATTGYAKAYRGDQLLGEARIGQIGTHGSYDGFEGFEDITGSRYNHSISASLFKNGDVLHISFTNPVRARDYWFEMVWPDAK